MAQDSVHLSRRALNMCSKFLISIKRPRLVLPILVMTFVAALLFWQVSNMLDLNSWVDHTDQVISQMNLVERLVIDGETGVRGFIITGDPVFLVPYHASASELPKAIDHLRNLVRDNPAQVERIDHIIGVLNDWSGLAKDSVVQKTTTGKVLSELIISRNSLMDSLRAEFGEFRSTEDKLRIKRAFSAQWSATGYFWILLIGFALIGLYLSRSLVLRRKMDMVLEKTAYDLKEAQRVAMLGSWSWDIKNDIVIWSEELYRIHGLDPKTPAPRYAEHPDLYTKESMERLDEAVRKVQSEGTAYEVELEIIKPDQSRSWILAHGEAVRNHNGSIVSVRGTVQDISALKQREQEFRESEAKFRTLTEAMPQIVWTARSDGWNTYFNQQWVAYTGLTLAESYGNGWNKPFHPGDQKRAWDAWQNAVQNGGVYSLECRLRRKDGAYRWWLVRSLPLRDEKGEITAWLGTCTDIDDIKRVEEALAASEEKYRSLIASAYDGVMIIRKDGAIEFANPQLEKMFGYNTGELIGQDYQILILDANREAHLGLHDHYISNPLQRKMGMGLHINARRKDGSAFPADISLNPFESNSEILVNCIVRDISEQMKFEEDRQHLLIQEKALKEEALNANRIKDEFLSTLSHELRTPLTTILGWSQEVQSKAMCPEVVSEGLSVIERSAQTQGQLIDDLLDVSRIHAGKMSLDVQVIDLVEVLGLAVASARIPANSKSLQIEMSLSVTSCKVSADPVRLQQVFWNLLSNAIKFTPRGGKIFVKLGVVETGKGSQAQVEIIDTGMGIKPEFLAHIFERFNQADSSTTRTFGGLGLGLAIVKSLVEMQKGAVNVESDGEGKGARFTVSLPLLQSKAITGETDILSGRPIDSVNLKGLKVLVVDDSADNLRLFSVMLKSLGSEVRLAESASEGIAAILKCKPDVLLSDISMPGEDGYSLIRKVRALTEEQGGKIPAVALTAYADSDCVKKAISAGFSAHLAKPVEKLKLARVISDLVKSPSELAHC